MEQQQPHGSGINPLSNALSWLRLPRPGSSRNLNNNNNNNNNSSSQLDLDGSRPSSLQLLQEQRAREMAEAMTWIRNHPDYEETNEEEEVMEAKSSTGSLEDKLNKLSSSNNEQHNSTFLRSRLEAMIPGAVGSDPAELVEKLERAVLDWLRSHQKHHGSQTNLRANSWDDVSLASSTVVSWDDSQQQQGDGTSRAEAVLARDMLHALSWLLKAKADTAGLSVEAEHSTTTIPDPSSFSSSSSKLADGSSLTPPFNELSSSIYPTKDVAVALEQLLLKPKAIDQQHQDGGMDQEDEERMSRLYHSQTSGRYTQPSVAATSSSSSVSTAGRTASSSMRPRDLSAALAMIRELGNRVGGAGTSHHLAHGRQHYDQSTASLSRSSSHDDAPSTLKEVPAVTYQAANHRMLEDDDDDDEEEDDDYDVDHDHSASVEHEDHHVDLNQPDSPPPPSPLSLEEQQDRDMAQTLDALRLGGCTSTLLSQDEDEDDEDDDDENDEDEDYLDLDEEDEEEDATEFDADEQDETSKIHYTAQPVALHHRHRLEVDDDHDDDENDSQDDEDEEMDNLVKSLTHDVVGQLDSLRIMGDDDQSETERGGGGMRRGRRRADGSTDHRHVAKSSLAEEERRAREMADAIESLRMLETFAHLDETDDDDELDQSLLYQRRRSSRKMPSDIDSLRMGDDEQEDDDDDDDDDESAGFLSLEERRAQEMAVVIDSLRMRQADSPVDSNEGGSIKSFAAELQRGKEMANALDDLLDTQHESPPESPTGSVRSEERRPRERRLRPRRTAGAVTRGSLLIDDSSATSFRSHTGTPSQTNRMDDGSDPSEIRAVSMPIEENGDRVRSMADALHWLRGSGEELDEASLSSSLSDFSDDEENTGGSSFEVSFELMSTEIDNAFQWLRQTTPNLDDVDDESLHAFRHLAGLPMVEGEMDPEDKSAARGAAIAWLQQNYFTTGDMDNVTLDSFAGLADSIACFTDDAPTHQSGQDVDMFLSHDDQVIALQHALDWLRSNDPNCDDMDDETLCKLATLAGVEVPRAGVGDGHHLSSRIEKQMVLDDVLDWLRKSENNHAIDPERIDAKTVEALLRMTGWSNGCS